MRRLFRTIPGENACNQFTLYRKLPKYLEEIEKSPGQIPLPIAYRILHFTFCPIKVYVD